MFALEVSFKSSSEPPALMYVRRPQAIIGASNFANVILDDMKNLSHQIRLVRGLGREFSFFLVASDVADQNLLAESGTDWPKWIEGVYRDSRQIDLGMFKISVTALDSDLIYKEGEPPDKSGIRILRAALTEGFPHFPAVAFGKPEVIVSFSPSIPLVLGRGRDCPLRIESPDISARHARIGFENSAFWVEDLGSTNGTFINGSRVAGKTWIAAGDTLLMAKQISLRPIANEQQVNVAPSEPVGAVEGAQLLTKVNRYPCILSLSEVAKPSRLSLEPGQIVNIGRDPSCDLWLGAPHVSRQHCQLRLKVDGTVSVTDTSTNGTEYDGGMLPREKPLDSDGVPHVLNFGAGITVGLIFSEEQETQFNKAGGALAAFGDGSFFGADDDSFVPMGQVRISDVPKLVGRRGRQATAHQLKAVYGASPRSTKMLIWLLISLFLLLLGILITLFGYSMV